MTSTLAEAGAEVLQEQNVFDEWTYDESWAAAWLGFLFIVSIVENTLLLLVFYKRRCMRTLSNRLVASLVVANLALTLVVMPLILLDMLRWTVMPEVTCHCLNGLIFMMAATSVTCSLGIHVDRYLAVLDPLHYCHRITRPKANAMIVATWLFSALLSVLDTFIAPVEWDWNVCSADGVVPAQRVSWTIQGAYVVFILFALFVAPFVAQTWIYWRIYIAAKSNSKRTWQSCATLSHSLSIPSTPLSESLQGECPLVARGYPAQGRPQLPLLRQNSFAQFVMHRWSNAGHQSPTPMGPFKEEGRTAAFSMAIMLTSLVCWTPFFLHFLLEWLWSGTSLWFHRMSIFSLLAFSAISPMLYGFHSHRARRELAQLFRRRPSFRLDSIQKVPPQRKFGVQHKWQVTKLEWRSDTSESASVSVIPGQALPKDTLDTENGAESPERTQQVSVTSAVRHWGRGSVSSGSSHTSDFSSISALTNLADW